MSDIKPVKVLFVCMGNICRSPTAHGVFEALVANHGLQEYFLVDSAGTHSYHVGSPPDQRAQATALARGVDLSTQRARRFNSRDFLEYDYVIGMDRGNLADMLAIKPDNPRAEASLMLDFADESTGTEVPDPYFGDAGFDRVYDLIDDAAQGLLVHIRRRYAF